MITLISFTSKEDTENERENIVRDVEEHTFKITVLGKICQQVITEGKTEGETETRRKSGEEKMTGRRRVGEKKISIISVNLCILLLHTHKYPPLPQLC